MHSVTLSLRRLALPLLATLALAGCAATPDFAELSARVLPPQGLALDDDAELRVALSDTDGTLAETRVERLGSGPWPVVLRYDRRALSAADTPRLSAELYQAGRLTHVTPEPVALDPEAPPHETDLPLAARP